MMKKLFIALLFSSTVQASTITWIAQSPNNDLNDTANWNPNSVPGSGDVANFDSAVSGVATNPTESSAQFSVSSINFPNLASPFTFTFSNQSLAFSGAGITGTQTNPSLILTNANNTNFLGDMLSFSSAGTTGSARITAANSGTLSGAQSNQSVGPIGAQLHAVGAYTIADGGTLTAQNSGMDSSTGTGQNATAICTTGQIRCDDAFTAGDNVTVTVENSGTFSGSNSTHADSSGIVQGYQFVSTDAFEVGDNFSCTVTNSGNSSHTGRGNSNVGVLLAAQVGLQTTAVLGDDASITITNTATNSADTTVTSDYVGYFNDNQLFVGEALQAGDGFRLTVSNTGTDSSTGIGEGIVAVINTNSGTSGDQVLLLQGGTLNNNATIRVTNSGTYTGTNTVEGSQVAGTSQGQFTVGDVNAIGSHNFSAGTSLSLTVSNSGNDSAFGMGGDVVGDVSTNQVTFFSPCSLDDDATITISNEGIYAGSASAVYVDIGSVGGDQLNAASTFEAGNNFNLQVTNAGNNEGGGIGNFFIGDVNAGQQVNFEQGLTVGDDALITITNSGVNASAATNHCQVGSMIGYGKQLIVHEEFQAGDNLQLTITNAGIDSSTMSGGHYVGFINDDATDASAMQCHLNNGGTLGNNCSITISNTGTFDGNNPGGNSVAVLGGSQFASVTAFEAGDQFSLTVSMAGTNDGSGQNNNSIAEVGGGFGGSQVEFADNCTVGNEASFIISNTGINHDPSGIDNSIGYVSISQMNVDGTFSAGTNLNMEITNSATNTGDPNNTVGYVVGSQLVFAQTCTLQDGSTIAATNSGTLGESQIIFTQGFDLADGSITIQATNLGTVTTGTGIYIGAGTGGDVNIVLENNELDIESNASIFTLGQLNGDSNSSVLCNPATLQINTDANKSGNFAGLLQDYSDVQPLALVKTGTGTQILAGINTYTGLTTVEEGTLVVNGSLPGDAVIDADGTLKGSGTIDGTVTNAGTIAPGESIGTITMGTYINNGADYEVEVNGAGESDLIDVTGAATLNGGSVIVIPEDFNFTKPAIYTIISTGSGITGTFSSLTSSVPAFLKLIYNPLTLQLTYLPIDALNLSCNARNAANCFVTLTSSDAAALTDVLFASSFADIQSAFGQMSPAPFGGPTEVQLLDAILVRSTYSKHLQKLSFAQEDDCDKMVSFWFDGIAQWQHQGNPFGYRDTTLGATFGMDYTISECWLLGAAFSTTYDQFYGNDSVRAARIHSYYGGLYSRWNSNKWYVDAALLGALNTFHTTREISFSTVDRCAYATHDGNEYAAHLGFVYQTNCASDYYVMPYLNLDYVWQHEQGYTESGAGALDLHVRKKNAMLFQGEAGVAFSTSCDLCDGLFTPMLTLAYINQTPCSSRKYCANFVNSTCTFTGTGGYYERNLFAPRLALAYKDSCERINISLHYDAQVGSSKYWAQDVAFDFTIRF